MDVGKVFGDEGSVRTGKEASVFQYERSNLMRYIIRVNKRYMVEEVDRGGKRLDSEGYMGC